MLARRYRLRERKRFDVIYKTGRSFKGKGLAAKVLPNDAGRLRAAVVVSKKTAKSAPLRNRIRRRVFALLEGSARLDLGCDIIISVYDKQWAEAEYKKLKAEIAALLEKANLARVN